MGRLDYFVLFHVPSFCRLIRPGLKFVGDRWFVVTHPFAKFYQVEVAIQDLHLCPPGQMYLRMVCFVFVNFFCFQIGFHYISMSVSPLLDSVWYCLVQLRS